MRSVRNAPKAILLLLWLFVSIPVVSQECTQATPRIEVFGGYSLLHTPDAGTTFHGWDAAVTANVNSWFGITSDFSGHYFDVSLTAPAVADIPERTLRQTGSTHDFLFGPRLLLRRSRYNPFVHALVGLSHGVVNNTLTTVPGTLTVKDNLFAAAFGGGVDIRLAPRVSIRPVQAEYFLTALHGFTSNRFRYSAGLVFHP